MKNFKLSILIMLLLGAAACKKSLNTTHHPTVTGSISTNDAADIAAGSLSLNSNGVANMASDAALNATVMDDDDHLKCGTMRSDTVSRQSSPGAPYTFSYKSTYNFMVDCNASSQPDSLSSNLTYAGSYSGPNMSGTNSGSSIFGVGGLLHTDTAFVINGEYKRAGSFSSKIDTAKHGSNSVDIVVSGLTLKKPTRIIESGTATIAINGTTPGKGSFSFTGTLVFNGDGKATLTINGNVYTINLETGEQFHH
jgi:hypothetical protein